MPSVHPAIVAQLIMMENKFVNTLLRKILSILDLLAFGVALEVVADATADNGPRITDMVTA